MDKKDTKVNTENTQRKIVKVEPKELSLLDDCNKTELPLTVWYSDGTTEDQLLPFDEYFQLVNRLVWNRPDFAKDANIITMKDKMKHAEPYNVFFTTLKHCPETKTQPYSVGFTDLLCPSFGKLKCSFHITFMADIKWIITQFALRNLHQVPMTIVHGYIGYPWPEKETMEQLYPKIHHHHIEVKKKETDIGCHHTKLSIFVYNNNSLRVVIGSANLYTEDWEIFNQQIWISPPCPKLPKGSPVTAGESPTGFKRTLLNYLYFYSKKPEISSIWKWIRHIKTADFRDVKVALIYTIPGLHFPRRNGCFFHFIGELLTEDCSIPAPKEEHDYWPIVAQTSSLGLVGRTPEEWLTTCFLKALGSHQESPYRPTVHSESTVKFNLIFPTVKNYDDGYIKDVSCCPYEKGVKDLQPWLSKHHCQWKADETKRSLALSHSKCYCRISPCSEKMVYYFLTSANLSRSAWGIPNKNSGIYVRSYEMGVLFLPKYFGEEYFEVKDHPNRKNKKVFPIMFDLPLTPYGPGDDSLCMDELSESDSEEDISKDAEINIPKSSEVPKA